MRVLTCLLCLFVLSSCVKERINNGSSFTINGVLNGVTATQVSCQSQKNAIWVKNGGAGECIKYYASPITDKSKPLVIFIHGDVGSGNFYRKEIIHVDKGYAGLNEPFMERVVRNNGAHYQVPFVFLARPGAFGSSGYQGDRYQQKNLIYLNKAIDEIKQTLGFEKLALAGQSGGGRVIAYLLNNRNDIACAALGSSAGSYLETFKTKFPSVNFDAYSTFIHDPYNYIDQMPKNRERAIYILADKEDETVSHLAQKSYYSKVKEYGHNAEIIYLSANGRHKHDLSGYASAVASYCANGMNAAQIQNQLAGKRLVSVYNTNARSYVSNYNPSNKPSNSNNTVKRTFYGRSDILWQGKQYYTSDISLDERSNTIKLTVYDGAKKINSCDGSFSMKSKIAGNWSLTCQKGVNASGDVSYYYSGKSFSFVGHDQDAQTISFNVKENRKTVKTVEKAKERAVAFHKSEEKRKARAQKFDIGKPLWKSNANFDKKEIAAKNKARSEAWAASQKQKKMATFKQTISARYKTITMSWAQHFVLSPIPISIDEPNQSFELDLENFKLGTCQGSFITENAQDGLWSLNCANQKVAQGTFDLIKDSRGIIHNIFGFGKDEQGNHINFQFRRPN